MWQSIGGMLRGHRTGAAWGKNIEAARLLAAVDEFLRRELSPDVVRLIRASLWDGITITLDVTHPGVVNVFRPLEDQLVKELTNRFGIQKPTIKIRVRGATESLGADSRS